MELEAFERELREFAAERNWGHLHTPRNLALALSGEVGELAAEFQWLTDEQATTLSGPDLAAVAAELADVFTYLVRLADTLGIDLIESARDKLAVNRQRFAPSTDGTPSSLKPQGPA
jgi:dCTP diphosphatase